MSIEPLQVSFSCLMRISSVILSESYNERGIPAVCAIVIFKMYEWLYKTTKKYLKSDVTRTDLWLSDILSPINDNPTIKSTTKLKLLTEKATVQTLH